MPRRPLPGLPPFPTVTLNLGDKANAETLAAAIPDARGEPFMTPALAVSFALDLARRVVEAGELERFRPPSPLAPDPAPPRPAPTREEVMSFIARFQSTRRR